MKNLFLILFSIVFSIMLISCVPESRATCDVESILLDEGAFPLNSTEDEVTTPIPEEPEWSAGRYMYFGETSAYHVVIDYPSVQRAQTRYAQLKKAGFQEENGPWVEPSISTIGKSADEMSFGCGHLNGHNACFYIGRYNTVVTFLRIGIAQNGFSEQDFEQAILLFEEKIMSCGKDEK